MNVICEQDQLRDFIMANTCRLRPPLVPEIMLHLAEESLPIWSKTEEELGEMNVPPPYWAFAWAGGQALARYILDTPSTVAGKTVLDIGSGSGLVAIAAKMAGAGRVIANDIDVFANVACRMNAAANSTLIEPLGTDIIANPQSTIRQALAPALSDADVVTLGDVFYERQLASDILEIAAQKWRHKCSIMVGDPSRSYFPRERFDKIAEYAVPVTRELEDNEIKNTAVWMFKG